MGVALLTHLVAAIICRCIVVSNGQVQLGNQLLRNGGWQPLVNQRTAVLSHPAGIFPDDLRHLVDVLNGRDVRKLGVDIVGVLAPEHGFRGDRQAESGDPDRYTDSDTSLPVYSVYRKSAADICAAIRALNTTVVLVDIQDVGVRLYTFVWTMFDVMAAVAGDIRNCGLERFVVLDRPNPLGGIVVEGPVLNASCCGSRYGRASVPHRHGMTIGELALLFATRELSVFFRSLLHVQEMVGWSRRMIWEDTGLPWVPPSPNLPTARSVQAYAATVFLEATNVTEGRGTTTPFEIFGAPFYKAPSLASALNVAMNCSTIACFRAASFQPTFFKYSQQVVQAVQWVRLPPSGKMFPAAVRLLSELRDLAGGQFAWDGSWFGTPGSRLIDLYAGTPILREMLDARAPAKNIDDFFNRQAELFRRAREPYLLYSGEAVVLAAA